MLPPPYWEKRPRVFQSACISFCMLYPSAAMVPSWQGRGADSLQIADYRLGAVLISTCCGGRGGISATGYYIRRPSQPSPSAFLAASVRTRTFVSTYIL